LGADLNLRSNLDTQFRLNYAVSVSIPAKKENIVGGAKAFDPSVLYPAPLVPGVNIAGLRIGLPSAPSFVTGPGSQGKFSQRQIEATNNFSYLLGSHQLKWGFDYRRLFPIIGRASGAADYIVRSENDLINGNVTLAQTEAHKISHAIFPNVGLYLQDTWRASKRLSLTYGLRWELDPAPGERDGIQPLNLVGLNNPATAALAPPNSSLYKATYNNFAPRIGVAYQVRQTSGHETVVRGGFGLFYDLNSESDAIGFVNAPFNAASSVVSNLNFPVANNVLQIPTLPGPIVPPLFVNAIDPNLKLPHSFQWNAAVEQGLGQNQSLAASYVASAGRRLLRSDNFFDVGPIVNGVSTFSQVTVLRNASSSNYQSLQLQFNRRLSRGLQGIASYTYSHSIDNASTGQLVSYDTLSTSLTGTSLLNPNIDRGNSDFDLRHAFRAAVTYNVPTWKANLLSRAVLGAWSVDAIGIAQTGVPVDLAGGQYLVSTVPDGFFQLRPNVTPGIPLYLYGAQCAVQNGLALAAAVPCPGGRAINFTPGAVAAGCPDGSVSAGPFCPVPTDANGNPTQVQGNLGRNVLRNLGNWQIDFALHRQFTFTERVHLQFRGEFFNVFNHPNFGSFHPNLFDGPGVFGLALGTLNGGLGGLNQLYQIGGPRSIQLSLKLQF
jgi:hypothetical protein